jgi:hypothetical protein
MAWPRSAQRKGAVPQELLAALRRGRRFPELPLPQAALARAADPLVQHPVPEQRLALRRAQRALPRAWQVPFWRRSAAFLGLLLRLPGAVPAHAREAVPRALHWARPEALARLAQVLLRAARDAPGLRPGAERAAAGRPAAPGAAEVQRRAGRQAWAQPREARGAEVPQLGARDAAGRPAVPDGAAGLPWEERPSARLSAAASVFRQDRVRLVELVQRRSERFARATACLRSAAPSTPLRQAARDEGVSYDVSPRKGSERCKDSSFTETTACRSTANR